MDYVHIRLIFSAKSKEAVKDLQRVASVVSRELYVWRNEYHELLWKSKTPQTSSQMEYLLTKTEHLYKYMYITIWHCLFLRVCVCVCVGMWWVCVG